MKPIVKHRIDWQSSCLHSVLLKYAHFKVGRDVRVKADFANNCALYCKPSEVLDSLPSNPVFDGCIVETMFGKKVTELKKAPLKTSEFSNGKFASLLAGVPLPSLIILRDDNIRAKHMSGNMLAEVDAPCLVVLSGSNMELFGNDFINILSTDDEALMRCCMFWGVPHTMKALFRSFIKVVAESANASASKD